MAGTKSNGAKSNLVVHISAIIAAIVAAGMIHATISDVPFLIAVELLMVYALSRVFGISLPETIFTALIIAGLGTIIGRTVWAIVSGILPDKAIMVNPGTAFVVVEILGWVTVLYFSQRKKYR